jgi:uncharacterized protein
MAMANRLSKETSPYLQQHADNPVDWYPWGEEALARARREDKPILLSIGYSACHWCHVMAHESFEDPQVAALMNRLFVNVKVDREERPDLDHIYQTAHQMLAQRAGGWPLTMFLSPQGMPFFGGTYFPKSARYGMPSFPELCERIAAIWRERRADIAAQDREVLEAFERTLPRGGAGLGELSREPLQAILDNLRGSFDARHGGFGGAPKFPHPTDLELCLRTGEHDMAVLSLRRMCEGGIYDQLGGGFCRYSTDGEWTIPHFEKMLYDNGPLLALLADAWSVSGEVLFARCAEETAGWIMREMQSPEGGYYSSVDADSEGEEGKFYVWSRDEIRSLLTPDEYALAAARFGLDGPPNFENRHWHLRIQAPAHDQALLEQAKAKLLAARARRVRPGRDEKVLTAWNALAIRGMVHAGRIFGQPPWVASARRALEFVRGTMWRQGRLLATYKDGRAHLDAYLDDHAFLAAAALELLQEEFSQDLLAFARALADAQIERFEDRAAGGFFFTAHDHERLIHRPKPGHDQATPSGNAVAAWVLGRLAALTGEEKYALAARRTVELFYPTMRQFPAGFAAMAVALDEQLQAPRTLVLRGERSVLRTWQAALCREFLPDLVMLAVTNDEAGKLPPVLDKPARPEPVNGWLCRGVTCLAPISDLVHLKKVLKEQA